MIDLEVDRVKFTPTIIALVFSESYGGCGLVVVGPDKLPVGTLCKAKIGVLEPMRGEIVWKTQLDNLIAKIGLKLLE